MKEPLCPFGVEASTMAFLREAESFGNGRRRRGGRRRRRKRRRRRRRRRRSRSAESLSPLCLWH